MVSTTTVVVTGIGATDTIINNGGGKLNDVNTAAQLSADATSITNLANPLAAGAAMTASQVAIGTGIAVLADDIKAGNITSTLADLLMVIGDSALFVGATASYVTRAFPPAEEAVAAADAVGNASTLLGVGIRNYDTIEDKASIIWDKIIGEAKVNIISSNDSLSSSFNSDNSISTAWSAVQNSMNDSLDAISAAIGDIGNSSFFEAATLAENDLSNTNITLTNLFKSTGATPQNIIDTINNNSFSITDNNIPNIAGIANFGLDGSFGLSTTGNGFDKAETDTVDNNGNIIDTVQNYNTDGTLQFSQTTTTSRDSIVATITGSGDVANLSNTSITLAPDATAIIYGDGNTFSGGAGSEITNNLSSGHSVVEEFGLEGGVSDSVQYFSGLNGTGSGFNAFDTTDFNNAFSSLGISNDLDFSDGGWTNFGSGNSFLNTNTFNFDGDEFTYFGNSDQITLPNFGNSELELGGGFNINSDFINSFTPFIDAQNRVSPLVLDLNGDGIQTTALYDTNVFFDIDGDGFAEKVGWVKPTEGLLAFDANNDGKINDITELFGDDKMPAFQKLAGFDSNHDGVINASDVQYSKLLVWTDANHNMSARSEGAQSQVNKKITTEVR